MYFNIIYSDFDFLKCAINTYFVIFEVSDFRLKTDT
jgi:hypothetical protein